MNHISSHQRISCNANQELQLFDNPHQELCILALFLFITLHLFSLKTFYCFAFKLQFATSAIPWRYDFAFIQRFYFNICQFLNLPWVHTPVCPPVYTKPSIFSTSSRLKLTKAGRKTEHLANSQQFYGSVYYTAAKALLLAAWGRLTPQPSFWKVWLAVPLIRYLHPNLSHKRQSTI